MHRVPHTGPAIKQYSVGYDVTNVLRRPTVREPRRTSWPVAALIALPVIVAWLAFGVAR